MRCGNRPFSLRLSMVALFSALNVLGDSIPLTPIVGLEQSRLTLGWTFASLTGLMLGPLMGSLTCFLASLVELFIGFQAQLPLGPLGLTRSSLAALQTGLLTTRRWILSGVILSLLIVCWILTPQGRGAIPVLAFHILGLILILAFRREMSDALESGSRKRVGFAVGIAAYCGNISRHLFGNLLFTLFASFPTTIFLAAMPLTLIEQVFFASTSAILGTSLILIGLRRFTYLG
ncbi:MAG: hypothetical protein QXI32_04960 [Candidatus Bathyarchaeia archaeon]